LKNLELLEISYNRLSKDGIKALKNAGIKVQAASQYSGDGEDNEYLYQGDIE
jgi:hypothetical protein